MYLKDRTNIDNLKMMLGDYLVNHHSVNINKPFRCLNPTHEDQHPSMSYTDKYHICKCFACGETYDIFDLIGIDYNVETFREKLDIACKLYPNIEVDVPKQFNIYEKPATLVDFTNYYKKCQSNINKTNYLETRGISSDLILKYGVGYDEKRDMVVFPINKNCYFGRGVHKNMKLKSKGTSYLWNEKLFHNSENKLIYVTESIIDSLSLETIDPTVKTVALNGLPNYKRLLKVIEENNYNGFLVLAFDNDKTGIAYQKIVKEELNKLNVSSFSVTMVNTVDDEKCKDLNDALIKNKDKLVNSYQYCDSNIKKIIEQKNLEKRGSEEIYER